MPHPSSRDVAGKRRLRRIHVVAHDSGREGRCLRGDLMVYAKIFSPLSHHHSSRYLRTRYSFTRVTPVSPSRIPPTHQNQPPTLSLMHSPDTHTYSRVHSPALSLIHYRTRTRSLMHSIHSLTYLRVHSLTHSLTPPRRTTHTVESTGALLRWRRVSREPTRYVTPYAHFNITICNAHTCIHSKLPKSQDMVMSQVQK